MPRGKWTSHKGKNRRFTNPDELEEERRREEVQRKWREANGEPSTDEEEEAAAGSSKGKVPPKGSDESSSESDDESGEDAKPKGVENLIEIENPNRIQQKAKKLSKINETINETKGELTRKEREELEKQQAAARYQKLHAEGKTNEARADLARLAIIRHQREEAAKKREAEKMQKEQEAKDRSAQRDKALGKRS